METREMNTQPWEGDKTVIKSDTFLRESGLQGGKSIGEHLALGSFIVGVPFFLIGFYVLASIILDLGFATNTAITIGAVLIFLIGSMLIIGGYLLYRDNQMKNNRDMRKSEFFFIKK
jgi:hypothetical protein